VLRALTTGVAWVQSMLEHGIFQALSLFGYLALFRAEESEGSRGQQ